MPTFPALSAAEGGPGGSRKTWGHITAEVMNQRLQQYYRLRDGLGEV